jgi:Methyltransferase domain
MIKYHLTALALKGFSCCEPARGLYRALGNWLGAGKRTTGKMPGYYFERVQRNVGTCLKYRHLRADDLVLELGTGWVHWEALTLRLFFDFHAVLYDVWDNRQLSALKSFVLQLEERFEQKGFLEGCDFDRARSLIRKIEAVSTFDDLYRMLGFRYVLDRNGLMESLPRNTFQMVISAGVMEHIPSATAPQFVSNMASLLVEGGLGMHSINIADHLYNYDQSASPKQYLTHSEWQWKAWYENGVQYINRIQRSDWLRLFSQAGFSLIEEGGHYADLTALRIHRRYQNLTRKDIECTNLVLVVRKGSGQIGGNES